MLKDRDRSMALVDRAAKAGFDTLLVTVDVPLAGARLRDKRNGFSIPPQPTLGTVINKIDRAPIPFHLLPDVAREVGTDLEVHLDTGIMSGADIVAATAPRPPAKPAARPSVTPKTAPPKAGPRRSPIAG